MSEPLVCCVCLANGRPAMLRRAVASFAVQTYQNRCMLIWDNATPAMSAEEAKALFKMDPRVFIKHGGVFIKHGDKRSIGAMRNDAAKWLFTGPSPHPEIIAHWDSDDWSHPKRLAEQVALLQSSGAECVGYHQAVFWNTQAHVLPPLRFCEEAWLYTGQVPRLCAIGASLCYWRKTWERVPFDDLRDVRDLSRMVPGEDSSFVAKVKAVGVSAVHGEWKDCELRGTMPGATARAAIDIEPRIICAIHGGNTVKDALKPGAREWRRASELDDYCREAMRLELHK